MRGKDLQINPLLKKCLVVGIIFLVIDIAVVPNTHLNSVKAATLPLNPWRMVTTNRTLYVDDDNVEGPWNGSLEYPYRHISDALRNASDGDTVYVFNGTYNEQAYLEKSIRLIGESKFSTIIDAGGTGDASVVVCHAYYTTVSGFTIRNSGVYYNNAGVWIYDAWDHNSAYNTITNNIICNNHAFAISLYQSKHNIIMNNTIFDNSGDVDFMTSSSYNTFSGNILRNDSLTIRGSDSNTIENNHIQAGIINIINGLNNTVHNNHLLNSRGIWVAGNYANNVCNNDLDGRPIYYYIYERDKTVPSNASQVVLVSCTDVLITQCAFQASYGVFLYNSQSCGITNNTFVGCEPAISITEGRYNRVIGNYITKSETAILCLNCYSEKIASNNITKNTYDIDLEACQDIQITNNTIAWSNKGIYMHSSYGNQIISNNFFKNNDQATFLADGPLRSHNYWRYNYWDDKNQATPKIIFGAIDTHLKILKPYHYYYYIYLPWMNVDWHPAQKPYDISR